MKTLTILLPIFLGLSQTASAAKVTWNCEDGTAGGVAFSEQKLTLDGTRLTYGKVTGKINPSVGGRDFITHVDKPVRVDAYANGTWLKKSQLVGLSISDDHTGQHHKVERAELFATNSVRKGLKNATIYLVLLAKSEKLWEKTRIQCKRVP